MKKLLPILFLLFPFALMAQTSDSTAIKLNRLETRQMAAGENLKKFHSAYSTSMAVTIASGAFMVAGNVLAEDNETRRSVTVLGSAGLLTGVIISIASHKYIKLAGMELTGQGTGVGIKKRF
ncbi:hypothetical protein [Adhaeribacter aquaticus]|uniref:hypothetical protein n=1 Tax=Adhaeribacter aquaticus TaxID=299567 RepID=UPI000421BE21|nr:hypothetical protein [Adhaeribacter aquaticus]